MSSFQDLKAKRDKRQPIHHAGSAQAVISTGNSSSDVTCSARFGDIPEGVEVRKDEKRGRGLYATRPHGAGEEMPAIQSLTTLTRCHRLKCHVGHPITGGFVNTEVDLDMLRMPPYLARDWYQDGTPSSSLVMRGLWHTLLLLRRESIPVRETWPDAT